MSLSTEIDRILRHSPLARIQPMIREQAPWLHAFLLRFRDLVLPFRSRFGLMRHQHRAIERFLSFSPDLSGPVLEIGTDLEGKCLRELHSRGVAQPIGINLLVDGGATASHQDLPRGSYEILQADVRHLPFPDNSLTSILSITAFEHVHDFDRSLAEIYRVLKPGGILYSDFGPIWSCSIGHHVWANRGDLEARHWKPGLNPVPHFGQFLLTPEELRAAVLEKSWVTPELAGDIVEWIFQGDGVNRLFYEDYVRAFEESDFEVVELTPVREHVPPETQARLEEICPGYQAFDVRMVEVVLRKPPGKNS